MIHYCSYLRFELCFDLWVVLKRHWRRLTLIHLNERRVHRLHLCIPSLLLSHKLLFLVISIILILLTSSYRFGASTHTIIILKIPGRMQHFCGILIKCLILVLKMRLFSMRLWICWVKILWKRWRGRFLRKSLAYKIILHLIGSLISWKALDTASLANAYLWRIIHRLTVIPIINIILYLLRLWISSLLCDNSANLAAKYTPWSDIGIPMRSKSTVN